MLQSPLRLLALVFGTVYVVVALLGFAVTGIGSLLGSVGILAVFQLNPLHNLAHILIGSLWLLSAANADSARSAAQVFGLVYVVLSILGFLEVGAALNALALNMADNFLHLLSGGAALLIGIFVRREAIFGTSG
jgi:Domain of unknown function (DUF4383)